MGEPRLWGEPPHGGGAPTMGGSPHIGGEPPHWAGAPTLGGSPHIGGEPPHWGGAPHLGGALALGEMSGAVVMLSSTRSTGIWSEFEKL